MKENPNILFIIIDALRPDHLGCYGYSQPISPNIDALAEKGILFEEAYSCTNSTDSSLTTIFSGKYPLSHGIISHGPRIGKEDIRRLNESGIRFLPEILKSEGYTTLAVDWLSRWHKRGYDYYSGTLHKKSLRTLRVLRVISRYCARLEKSTVIDEAHLVTSRAIDLLRKNRNKKFFLFLHYWDTHWRYAPPTRYYRRVKRQVTMETLEQILNPRKWGNWALLVKKLKVPEAIARYDASIAYVDHQIGILRETLRRYGILDRTFITLTSDHGESLGEHGIYFDHHGLYDVTIHVPLIFKYSGLPRNKRIKGFIQHFDLVPTIFDLLDVKSKDIKFDGKSVMPLINKETKQLRNAIYVEEAVNERKRAIRTNNYKYIHALSRKGAVCRRCKRVHGGLWELYDLKRDPKETLNIAKDKPDVSNSLRKDLSEWIESLAG